MLWADGSSKFDLTVCVVVGVPLLQSGVDSVYGCNRRYMMCAKHHLCAAYAVHITALTTSHPLRI